jgi:hypothetical protein
MQCDVRCNVQCDVRCNVQCDVRDVGDVGDGVSTVPRVLSYLGLVPRTEQNA